MVKKIEEYLALPYSLEVLPLSDEDGGGYYARYVDFGAGAHGDGKTPRKAAVHAREGLKAVLEVMLEHGDTIPKPAAHRGL